MPPRSIATGTISFGLVTIPVKLYSATSPSAGISFNLLHKDCGSRLKQSYTCAKEGVPVAREDMVKGYELQKDRYVVFTPEELKALEEVKASAIEIAEFIPAAEVDPIYYDKPYYLGPDKGGDKAYRLLSEALTRSKRVALARYAARGKEYLVVIRPHQKRLVMQQLLHADEIRPEHEIEVGDSELRDPEVQLALKLIDQTSSEEFRPEAYPDTARQRVQEAIERKAEGQELVIAEGEAPRANVIDLMDALKASLSGGGKAAAAAGEKGKAAASERKPPRRAPGHPARKGAASKK